MNIKKIALCILTRNELDCLKVVFPQIPKPSESEGFHSVYAIDGGSTDGTIEYFEQHGVPVISQSKRGRGEAFLLAFKNIEADAYIFFSPDGNEDVLDIKKFKGHLEQGADLVIASRMMKDAFNEEDIHFFKWRKWANNVFNIFANVFFKKEGPYITDSINGFRALTNDAVHRLELDAWDYTIEYQMTMRALDRKMKIVEFPTIEGQRVAGETGAQSIPTGLRFIKRFFIELGRKQK